MITKGVMFVARREGRICPQCQWIITKKEWKKGFRLCGRCIDINKGVNVNYGHGRYRDEPVDKTGEM